MPKPLETGLIIRKTTPFDKIRETLFSIFFHKEYEMMEKLEKLLEPKKIKSSNIIIPKEIKLRQIDIK